MSRKQKWMAFFLLFLATAGGYVFYHTLNKKKYESFTEWHKANYEGLSKKKNNNDQKSKQEKYHRELFSSLMPINKIYRSMQGPFKVETFGIPEPSNSLFKKADLLWLTGYSVDVVGEDSTKLPDEFMCHNNLSIDDASMPWKIKTQGTDLRLFTLTEGQTKIQFPPGFGIPVLSSQDITVSSQVLNHNILNADFNARHKMTIDYVVDEANKEAFVPLFQQAVFVTKLLSGPEGQHGSRPDTSARVLTCLTEQVVSDNSHDCSVEYANVEKYNPYEDIYGRKYTGHWTVPPGKEILTSNVTAMLDLPYDTRVHYIAVHLHPFAESLELRDITTNEVIFKAYSENYTGKIGLKHIDHFSSSEGIMLYKDHQYELTSSYNNTSGEEHTAMATMFLYLHDKK